MNQPPVEFNETVTDDDGVEHEYRIIPFNPDDGFDILSAVLACTSEPLGRIFDALGGEEETTIESAGANLAQLLGQEVDTVKLGGAVAELVSGIQKQGGSRLVKRILSQTFRDGHRLNDAAAYNRAYRANYGELFRAIFAVLRVNFGNAVNLLQRPTNPVTEGMQG